MIYGMNLEETIFPYHKTWHELIGNYNSWEDNEFVFAQGSDDEHAIKTKRYQSGDENFDYDYQVHRLQLSQGPSLLPTEKQGSLLHGKINYCIYSM